MPIPDYQSIMLPLLKYASDQKQHSVKQAYEDLANEFNLTTEEKNELLPSGTQQIYKNRIGWARTYLSGDGGIDGIIKEDKLGLDLIYIQAKRWDNVVSRPEIQKFVGALQGKRAKKGIFITTSYFSKDASEYTKMIDNKVILIDGHRLAQLMIENEIGVTNINTYHIRRLDSDYFLEE